MAVSHGWETLIFGRSVSTAHSLSLFPILSKRFFMPANALVHLTRSIYQCSLQPTGRAGPAYQLCGCGGLRESQWTSYRSPLIASPSHFSANSCFGKGECHSKYRLTNLKYKRTRFKFTSAHALSKGNGEMPASISGNKGASQSCKEEVLDQDVVEEIFTSEECADRRMQDRKLVEGLESLLGLAPTEETQLMARPERLWLKGTSSAELESPYLELNLKPMMQKYGGLRVRQHVNPLKAALRISEVPKWDTVFHDPNLPLHLDIGSGMGRYLLLMAHRDGGVHNYLGLEIRKQLVDRSNFLAKELQLKNIHFLVANANVALEEILATYPGRLVFVTILCPDPHFKKKHRKRRVVQQGLVQTIAENLVPGGQVFLQSDVEEVALDMERQFREHGAHLLEAAPQHQDPQTGEHLQWLDKNPLEVPTEREVHVTSKGGALYRILYVRKGILSSAATIPTARPVL